MIQTLYRNYKKEKKMKLIMNKNKKYKKTKAKN